MSNFAAKWKTAKITFTKSTGLDKKPSEKVLGVWKKGTGIETALEKVDELMDKGKTEQQRNAAWVANVGRAHQDYHKVMTAYLVLLEQAARAEPVGPNRDKYVRGVEVLEKELVAINKEIKTLLIISRDSAARQDQATAVYRKEVALMKSDLARLLAQAAQVKAQPTPDNFNEKLQPMLAQLFKHISELKTENFFGANRLNDRVADELTDLGRKLPATTPPDQISRLANRVGLRGLELQRMLKENHHRN